MSRRSTQALQGHVKEVIRQKPNDGVIVFLADFGTVVGPARIVGFNGPGGCGHSKVITPGDWFECSGRWRDRGRYGLRFAVDKLITRPAADTVGLKLFLGSGLLPGVGPIIAEAIVGHFGTDILRVLDMESAALLEVPGIGKRRMQQVVTGWHQLKVLERVRQNAYRLGIDPVLIIRVFEVFGEQALVRVRRDPYSLIDDVNLSFRQADEIAKCVGEPLNSLRRARAGLRTVLRKLADWREEWQGDRGDLIDKASAELGIPVNLLNEALDRELGDGSIVQIEEVRPERPALNPERDGTDTDGGCGDVLAKIYMVMGFSYEEAVYQARAAARIGPAWSVKPRGTGVRGVGDDARASYPPTGSGAHGEQGGRHRPDRGAGPPPPPHPGDSGPGRQGGAPLSLVSPC